MDEQEKLRRAKAQVQAMTVFYVHFAVFAVVVLGLFIINAAFGKSWWAHWVLIVWGVLVAAHAIAVFTDVSGSVRNWQARKTKELADKM